MIEYMYSILGRTSTLCLYNYSQRIPIVFPRVDTLTLIQCQQIDSIVQSSVFPNLKTIHYLSTPPTRYTKIPNVTWIFPSFSHEFYHGIIEAGIGRVDDDLITKYITNIKHAEDGTEMTLWIPDYGMMDADVYHHYLNQYIAHCGKKDQYPFETYHQELLKQNFMKRILL
jgi:hypothetical protein